MRSGPLWTLLLLTACAVYEAPLSQDQSLRIVQDPAEPDAQARAQRVTDARPALPDATSPDAASDATYTNVADATPDASMPPAVPPAGLNCLARYYGGTVQQRAGAWGLLLGSSVLPWDDGVAKTLDQALSSPDLEDTFRMPYATGAIAAVSSAAQDPGRVRVEPVFNAAYGADEAAVLANLESVDFLGTNVRFHRSAAAALTRVVTRLRSAIAAKPALSKYLVGEIGGTYVRRNIAGTPRISAHSYGVAIDIIVKYTSYWEWDLERTGSYSWRNQVPQEVVDAFEAEGFAWGGRWYHYDTMHFEYRPELLDRSCWP